MTSPEVEFRYRDRQADGEPAGDWFPWRPVDRVKPWMRAQLAAQETVTRQFSFAEHQYRRGPGFAAPETATCPRCKRTVVVVAGVLAGHDRTPVTREVCSGSGRRA